CYLLVKYLIKESSVFGEYVMLIIGVALIVTAALLFYSERKKTKSESPEEQNEDISDEQQVKTRKSVADLSLLQMTASGLFQGFSIIPGISRSGITMSGLLFMSTKKEDAIKGSFLMSIPAVLGGFVLDVTFTAVEGGSIFPIEWWQILIAIVITAIVGYLTMELFLFIARKYNFSLICLILGILTIVLFAVRFAA
ncbi:MAG: undecaprenyl-diphosphate phosphatase, partial [Candidatus Heimdallarchaeaceae archaeon]